MTQSNGSWLCISCGHVQAGSPESAAPLSAPPTAGVPLPAAPPVSASVAPTPPNPSPSAPAGPGFGTVGVPSATVSSSGPDELLLPVRRSRRLNAKLIALILAALIVIGLIGTAVYLYLIAPQLVLASHLARLVGAKTSVFTSAITADFGEGSSYSIKLAGKYDITDQAKPKLDLSVTGKTGNTAASSLVTSAAQTGTLAAQLRLVSQIAYFKIDSISLFSALIPITISKDWYKYDLSSSASTSICVTAKKDSGSLFGSSILTKVPVKGDAFKGIDSIDGTPMLHYIGTVDNSKLKAAIDSANKKLSADCQLDVSVDDYKNITITYELWRGWSKDRISFEIADSNAKTKSIITLDTGAYNKPVTIDAPKDAKDVTDLLSAFTSGGTDTSADSSPTTTRTNVPTSTPTVQQQARDTQRKTDIRSLQKGLEEYFVTNNSYPKTLTELTTDSAGNPAIIKTIPLDPTNKTPYIYTYTLGTLIQGLPTTYTLRACLENAADTGIDVVNPVAPCKTATYELSNLN
jgi:hypothetical protein